MKAPILTASMIGNFGEMGDLKHIYKNQSDKDCFPHDAASCDSKDLA